MTEYRLAPAAERDLEAIWVYTFQEWGVAQANHYVDIITEAFAELAQNPKTAPACDHIRSGYRRRSIERHVIYFRATEYGIAVIRVLHDRMDVSRYI
ncbi:type II toxin-antitoxin system RelE/ParE family toxin [Pseudomonas viridiflava]|uniref:type II toxin-antitoxin system RelE/ParE family toxin n=1 Tax=Pseudomonas viridiflava TaxID=33069 RepID=UPI000F0234C8|nr:type II toxin-antitoxin system RelE/ParE family toxin [Pseudomonas viridiflava]MDY0937393.1 type II toxin-antitoxin system RelE/ParE family toxin [Pseudomonas viridiflava]MDY1014951.1 type II toxin-antitoxin system RelE/ParE family toxin [Pseudomonas viridiflava]QXG38126.1 type II toxin-antitoxin system RelE/ParE family toxin [Pseudomonas viridiflava]QXG41356.1 type II toxin-antitoxin system RelE/ParE family toxin [Pseudomonas viridiflava]